MTKPTTQRRRATLSAALMGAVLTLTGCADAPGITNAPETSKASQPESEIVVAHSRIIEGIDLCAIVSVEELEWLLGRPLTARPAPDPIDPRGCSVRFGDATITITARTAADGVRAVVAGNAAFADLNGTGCSVSVALLPGSTQRVGSYLTVASAGFAAEPEWNCRTAGRLAEYLLDQLPKH